MEFTGLHHITMITGDAQENARYYGDLLGLRLVKKTVNFDQPQAYHLYFGDETGAPGSILTWFEFPGAARGRAGAGSIHTLQLAVADEAALDFWEQRLDETTREPGVLRFADYDGLKLELVVSDLGNAPLRAQPPRDPGGARDRRPARRARLRGLRRRRGRASSPSCSASPRGRRRVPADGSERRFRFAYDAPPACNDQQGAGSVHHIAWASRDEDHLAWQERIANAGGYVTDVRDRDYFKSIYFRIPSGVLFEIATLSPGFAVDEDAGAPGRGAAGCRSSTSTCATQLEATLRPVNNPRVLA